MIRIMICRCNILEWLGWHELDHYGGISGNSWTH